MTPETTPTTLRDREPGTEAKRRMDELWEAMAADVHAHGYSVRDALMSWRPLVEEQAATEARRELLAKVEGLRRELTERSAMPQTAGWNDAVAAVLRLIEESRP